MRFDTLFMDPRHFRSDLRLMRSALRRGWLAGADRADLDALAQRFAEASEARGASGRARSDAERVSEAEAMLELAVARAQGKHRVSSE